ncbi:MAG: undecaprenyl-diphosphatase [Sulfurospirillaceae bacterium]|nr:undecaprenyl-diphosphatase [Sulfurospirillaceae bacterium]
MEKLNKFLFLYVNQFAGHHHNLDLLMIAFAEFTPYIFMVLLLYLWFKNKKEEGLFAGYAALLALSLNQIIGLFYFHPRPFMENLGHSLISHNPDNSFPSDHVSFTLSIAFVFLTFKTTRTLGIITSILGLMCGISRVYSGVHWPFDVMGSIIISIFSIFVIYKLNTPLLWLNRFIINTYYKIIKKEFFA